MPPSHSLLQVEISVLIGTCRPRLECCDISPSSRGNSLLFPWTQLILCTLVVAGLHFAFVRAGRGCPPALPGILGRFLHCQESALSNQVILGCYNMLCSQLFFPCLFTHLANLFKGALLCAFIPAFKEYTLVGTGRCLDQHEIQLEFRFWFCIVF